MNKDLELKMNPLYQPFFTSNKFLNINIKGRGSGGSHFLADLALIKPLMQIQENSQRGYKLTRKILLVRYVKERIGKSLWESITSRIDRFNLHSYVQGKNSHMYELDFGIKGDAHKIRPHSFITSNSSQTASNKSIEGITDVLFEEADELTDVNEFDTFLTSLRPRVLTDENNQVVKYNGEGVLIEPKVYLVCNPPNMHHFLVERYFDLKEVDVTEFNVSTKFYKMSLKKKWEKTVNFVHGTWRDNQIWLNQLKEIGGEKYVEEETYRLYEHYKYSSKESDREYYLNQILGLVPSQNVGLIYKDWTPITDDFYNGVEDYDDIYYGLDFGFSVDPNAFLEIKQKGFNLYIKELLYETRLDPVALSNKIKGLFPSDYEDLTIYADNNEQYVSTLRERGIRNIKKASFSKGNNSILTGINILKGYKVFYTKSSVNLIKELEEYHWILQQDGGDSKPSKNYNHDLDAIRYAVVEHNQTDRKDNNIKEYYKNMRQVFYGIQS